MYHDRKVRDQDRGNVVYLNARRNGADVMTATEAQIVATFNEAAKVNMFKRRVEKFIKFGVCHPAVRARYGARSAMLRGRSIDAACHLASRWFKDARKVMQISSMFGRPSRLEYEVTHELCLLLRMIRKGNKKILGATPAKPDVSNHLDGLLSFLLGQAEPMLEAAE